MTGRAKARETDIVNRGREHMNPFTARGKVRSRTPIRAEMPEPRDNATSVSLRLYDAIDSWGGYWGVSAKEFAAAMDGIADDVPEIRLHINSPGGEVWEGIAILNQLRAHPARTVAVIEGIAASAASFIAAGCDEVVMMPNAEIFIHNAMGVCIGNHHDMDDVSARLQHIGDNIASIYAAKAGGTVPEWRAVMDDEPFYSAQEAVDNGLADRIEGPATDDAATARQRFNITARAAKPSTPTEPPATEPGKPTNREDTNVSDTIKAGLRDRLGITDANADDATYMAAIDEALSERASDAPKPAALPDGVVTIEAAVLAELQAGNAVARTLQAERDTERQHRAVETAVADGRVAPSRREHWHAQMAADEEGATAVLNGLAPGTIPVGVPKGHTSGVEDDADAVAYSNLFGTPKEA